MKVLMFGWEFPPNNLGGLGTACFGLTKALSKKGIKLMFVLPKKSPEHAHLKIICSGKFNNLHNLSLNYINSALLPYLNDSSYFSYLSESEQDLYGKNLFEEVQKYSLAGEKIAKKTDFDIIHCHDWMTFKAGIKAKKATGKPLIVHVHATDFDRTLDNPNKIVYNIEKEGMEYADYIIAVSHYTKNKIIRNYGIRPEKIHVVHNGIENNGYELKKGIKENDDIVLFLGRLTLQKGPEYFIDAAAKVLRVLPETKFVIGGSGEMLGRLIDKTIALGIARNVLFAGHLSGREIDKAYKMAKLYVMPSVSEPFGITPLESIKNSTPVLISKNSGVSEVLQNCLKVDFWDIDEMASKIISVLRYKSLHSCLVENSLSDIKKLSWENAAEKCINIYNKARSSFYILGES